MIQDTIHHPHHRVGRILGVVVFVIVLIWLAREAAGG